MESHQTPCPILARKKKNEAAAKNVPILEPAQSQPALLTATCWSRRNVSLTTPLL